ncbi:hypothetical protein [Actinosynnema sp. NPDC020468]|uniref:hypothetical protein n=1 Tax=Actinosynnema sp. NPDC020468 TaxID=3154488 RepID=UPI00340D5549
MPKNTRRGRQKRADAVSTPPEPKNWFARRSGGQRSLLVTGGVLGALLAHYLWWVYAVPAVGEVVGSVPVVSTVVGWAYGGGAIMAVGVALINHESARAKPVMQVALAWSVLALLCLPFGWANDVSLPTDYWAGVFAGAWGVLATPLAAAVAALLWWLVTKVFLKREVEATEVAMGWLAVAYSFLLLVWGSTLLRF